MISKFVNRYQWSRKSRQIKLSRTRRKRAHITRRHVQAYTLAMQQKKIKVISMSCVRIVQFERSAHDRRFSLWSTCLPAGLQNDIRFSCFFICLFIHYESNLDRWGRWGQQRAKNICRPVLPKRKKKLKKNIAAHFMLWSHCELKLGTYIGIHWIMYWSMRYDAYSFSSTVCLHLSAFVCYCCWCYYQEVRRTIGCGENTSAVYFIIYLSVYLRVWVCALFYNIFLIKKKWCKKKQKY